METVVYTFDELSDDAKQKAMDNNREINVDYPEWYHYVYDNFVSNIEIYGRDYCYIDIYYLVDNGGKILVTEVGYDFNSCIRLG